MKLVKQQNFKHKVFGNSLADLEPLELSVLWLAILLYYENHIQHLFREFTNCHRTNLWQQIMLEKFFSPPFWVSKK